MRQVFSMTKTSNRVFEFSSFRVDVAERKVFRDGEVVVMTPKVFDILLVLLENRGNTVEKDDLIRQIWVDTFVEEGSLNRNISTLRKALGDDSSEQKFIKTLPKRGYRFTAQVVEFIDERQSPREASVEADETSGQRIHAMLKSWRWRSFAAPLFVLIAVLTATAWLSAFLFQNELDLSGLPMNERRQLKKYGSSNPEASRDYVTGRKLWHTRSADDLHNSIFHLERAVRLDPGFALAQAALADAYAFDVLRWKEATGRAEEAARLNSNLGQPYATIGFVQMYWNWKLDDAGAFFRRAIELSPDYATAHQWYALNLIATRSGGAALAEMKRAVELEPQSSVIGADLCQLYYFLEKYDDAIAQCQKTLAVDADFLNAHVYLYEIYSAREMYPDVVAEFFKIELLKSDFELPFTHQKELRKAFEQNGIHGFWSLRVKYLERNRPSYQLAKYYARLGEKQKALTTLKACAELKDFDFVFFQTDPIFRELHQEPEFNQLRQFVGLSVQ